MYVPPVISNKNIPHAKEFYAWMHSTSDEFADFDADQFHETQIKDIVGKPVPQLHYLGHHGSGSLICLWEQSSSAEKIAWLDSEGYPFGVFANSFNQLLGLLPYGTGFIYDVLSKSADASNTQLSFVREWYADTPEQMINANKNRFPGLSNYLEFLKKENIKPDPDPVATIFNNYRDNLDFADSLTNQ